MDAIYEEYHQKTLHLPRVLCLHGGGTNACIFRMQCRMISHMLEPHFRFVYAEAPFDSMPGPDVAPVYAEYGPFKRWLPEHDIGEDRAAISAIDRSIKKAMLEDDRSGATGSWEGLLGFSQGAKLAASLAFRQQLRVEKLGWAKAGSDWKFAVLMAGRAPIVSLDLELGGVVEEGRVLELSTIHVHGLADPGLRMHRQLAQKHCSRDSARVLEWNGAHRVPVKTADVKPLVDEILNLANGIGAI
ncbi:serine hydrolase FSH [Aspergillus varians]